MSKKLPSLIIWILSFQLIGYLIGKMSRANIVTWYQTLNKSALNPPDFVFPVVWSILYIMIAVAGWYLWQQCNKKAAKPALFFYGVQVLMNWAWTPLFFQFHLVQLAFYWIIGIVVATLITILISWKHFKFTALMLMPYCFWLLFAGYLNWVIWMKN